MVAEYVYTVVKFNESHPAYAGIYRKFYKNSVCCRSMCWTDGVIQVNYLILDTVPVSSIVNLFSVWFADNSKERPVGSPDLIDDACWYLKN